MQKYVIFGAGKYGKDALELYGDEVYGFLDNHVTGRYEGLPVMTPEEFVQKGYSYAVLIASKYKTEMMKQLDNLGVESYRYYLDERAYYRTGKLVVNPYENSGSPSTEDEWNAEQENNKNKRQQIKDAVKELVRKEEQPVFDHIEIETVNRCNGGCDFCPVAKLRDPREFCSMTDTLFRKIIDELSDIEYSGRICLFSNNEPFLDDKIIERHKYAREKLPLARFHLFTNGTLLTLPIFLEIMKYLDELIIDNYQQDLQLIKPCREIKEYCEEHPEYRKRVTIVLRDPHEIRTSRGGDAPNRKQLISYGQDTCMLPFKQMIVRPDGKISLCCNDPLGRNTLGDVSQDTLVHIWNNDRFKMVRKQLAAGRENWNHCKYCDVFNLV